MQQEQNDDTSFGPAKSLNAIYFFSAIYATCVLPFLRCGMGSHAMSFNALFAMALMLIVGGVANASVMLRFIAVWLLAVILQRINGLWQCYRHGRKLHSRYLGDSLLVRILGIHNTVARVLGEPILTLLVGTAVTHFSPIVGHFIDGAAVAVFIKSLIDRELDRTQVRNMLDAHIEQVYVSRRYHEGE